MDLRLAITFFCAPSMMIKIDSTVNALPANLFLEVPTITLAGEILSNSVTLTASIQPVIVSSPILINTVPETGSLALLLISLLSLRKFRTL